MTSRETLSATFLSNILLVHDSSDKKKSFLSIASTIHIENVHSEDISRASFKSYKPCSIQIYHASHSAKRQLNDKLQKRDIEWKG